MGFFRHNNKEIAASYEYKEPIPTKIWVEQEIYLYPDASPKTGWLDLSTTPHLREMYDDFDRPEVWKQALKSASQIGKTLFLSSIASKMLVEDPCPIQYMTAVKDQIGKYVKAKIHPIQKGIKKLQQKFKKYKADESIRGKIEYQQVDNGYLAFTGTTSSDRKSLTIKVWIGDELGEFDPGTVDEATERTKMYEKYFRKIIGASTIVHPQDEIVAMYDSCEVNKEYHYACPDCNSNFYPKELVFLSKEDYAKQNDIPINEVNKEKYKKEALKDIYVECPECKCKITNKMKEEMIESDLLKWIVVKGDGELGKTIGYDINSLCSWYCSYESIVDRLIEAGENEEKLDIVYRGYYNRFYESKSSNKSRSDILSLGNNVSQWIIPRETIPHGIYLTIDTQKDHFWYTIYAFQYGATPNIVSYGKIYSFDEIERLFEREYKDQDNNDMYISKLAIDYQGYVKKEIIKDEDGNDIVIEDIDRMEEVKTWGVGYMRKVGYDRVYLTRGVDELTNQTEYSEFKLKVIDQLIGKEIDIRAWKMSNLRCASILDQKIQRSIEKLHSETPELYQDSLFFIYQDIIDILSDEEHKSVATDLDRQLRSEVLKYKDSKAKKMTYERVSRENHIWDTSKMAIMLSVIDNLAPIPRPTKQESTQQIISKIKDLF